MPLLLDGDTLLKSGGMSKNGAPSLAVSRGGTKKSGTAGTKKKGIFVGHGLFSLFSGSNSNLGQFIWGRGGGGARLHAPRKEKKRGKLKLGKFRTQPERQRHKACVEVSVEGEKREMLSNFFFLS